MYQKPLSYLNNTELADPAKAEAAMDGLLLYACYPGAASVAQMKAQRALYRAYIPLYNALGAAGWEPIPYAQLLHRTPGANGSETPSKAISSPSAIPAKQREMTLTLDLKALAMTKADFQAVTGCTDPPRRRSKRAPLPSRTMDGRHSRQSRRRNRLAADNKRS